MSPALPRLSAFGFYLHTAFAADQLLHPHRTLHRTVIRPAAPSAGCHPSAHADALEALAWFDAEHPCLLAVHRYAVKQEWHGTVLQLTWALDTYHLRRGRLHDNLAAWKSALAAALHLDDPAGQMVAYRLLGVACTWLDLHAEAIDAFQHALKLAARSEDLPTQAHTHNALARVWSRQGDNRRALTHATRAMRLYRAVDNPTWVAAALNSMGWYAALLGRFTQARLHCEAALKIHRRDGYRQGEASVLDSLGYIAHHSGDLQSALDHFTQALELFRDLGNRYDEADTLSRLGHTYVALGRHDDARRTWQLALDLYCDQRRGTEAGQIQQQLA